MKLDGDNPPADRRHPDRLAVARHRPRRRGHPQGPRPRDLRPGILRQDHAHACTSSPAPRSPAASPRSSTPSTRSTRRGPSGSACKLDDLLVSQPDTGEQALEICELLVRSNAVDVIVIDSVAALIPRAEIEGEMGDSHVGLQARLMSQALRKLTGAISKSKLHRHLHQPDPREDRRDVRQPRNHARRPGAEVLRLGPHRRPPHRQRSRKAKSPSATARGPAW